MFRVWKLVNVDKSRSLFLAALGDHRPWSAREVVKAAGLGESAVYGVLSRCWMGGFVFRTEKLIYVHERIFEGRGGVAQNTRPYHLYVLRPEGVDSLLLDGRLFKYVKEYLDVCGGGRRSSAEVDRVWEVTPGIFAPAITYVLSCKWGLVTKRHVDDFLDVLRWSKEFGVDTPDGRDVKQGVVGVFAASAFNPRENVQLKDGSKISLTQYAARMRLQLLRASDFNQKLHERGCPKGVSVQKVCSRAENDDEARETLDKVWSQIDSAEEILDELLEKNKKLYEFEEMLEEKEQSEE